MTTRLQPTTKMMTVNDLRTHYLEWGNTDSPPVVCVHGYTSSAQAFNALARHLQGSFHLIAPDVRGHGESGWSARGAYGYLDQTSDLAAFVDRLELEKFTLIGTSMGGIIAMAYAAAHAQRLNGLVINDIGPDAEAGTQRITQTVGARPESFATLDEAMEYRRRISPITAARPEEDQRELTLGVLKQAADGRWAWKMDPAYITQRIASGAPVRPVLWPALTTLNCPTLVIWGTDSDVLSEAQAKRMTETLPRGELVAVPGVGHAPTLVEPAALSAIDRLLAAVAR
jgi:pimeloyl-ACP methyl ester carboxylesterase